MNIWFIVGIVIFVLIIFLAVALFGKESKPEYEYKKREYIMTQSERKCFDALMRAIGDRYYIFPQIHLPAFLEHKIVGQNWNGAFRHIDEKSVDFVLCDKDKLSPRLAIELDDKSHGRPERQERDREVERILKQANMPLLRLKDRDISDISSLVRMIEESISVVLQG